MNKLFKNKKFTKALYAVSIGSMLAISSTVWADDTDRLNQYILQGPCASLPASRTTEFHGNPETAELLLGMAGNQWVVFDQVLRDFNAYRGLDASAPAFQDSYTLAELRAQSRGDYYFQLIPPGTIRDQIKSGCMILANIDDNEEDRNFLPLSIQVNFDVFASTNYNLMQDLARNGFVAEALPYIRNKLDLLVLQGNPNNIGVAGTNNSGLPMTGDPNYDKIFDIVMDLLNDCDRDADGCTPSDLDDLGVPVSQVDHINEGIHRGINAMYQRMDTYIRDNDPTQTDIYSGDYAAALDAALAGVSTPQAGSPAAIRIVEEGITTNFNLDENPNCNYADGPYAGKLRFCEYAVLNKSNSHETRVHHVETPERVRDGRQYTGPLWITEVVYAQAAEGLEPVEGVDIAAADPGETVNRPVTYSIARLATSKSSHKQLANDFIEWIRGPGQQAYIDGGFIPLNAAQLAGGECYALDKDGNLLVTPRVDNSCK